MITSLQQKKFRIKEGLFLAEGPKVISELQEAGLVLHSLFSTEIEDDHSQNYFQITERELQKLSTLKTPNKSVGVFKIPSSVKSSYEGISVALDAIRDPGNLGTIIRLCDWFGVSTLLCSLDTVDCFNPKVVQATMGSIGRLHIEYVDLPMFIEKTNIPVFGGVLNGNNVYTESLPDNAILVMGNEANGISAEIEDLLTHKVTIPQFGTEHKTESLNVATATAILLSEFNRSIEK